MTPAVGPAAHGSGPGSGPGADLARVALEAARAAARSAAEPGARTAARSVRSAGGGGARDPEPLGAVVRGVVTERAWGPGRGPDGVLAHWPEVAAELAGHVRAVGFSEAEGRLDLLPDAPAYALHLRLLGDELLRRFAAVPGGARVREIRVLEAAPPGAPDLPDPPALATQRDPADPTTRPPVEGADGAYEGAAPSAGYRRALAAHRVGRQAGLRARGADPADGTAGGTAGGAGSKGGAVRRDRS
ncbi:DciA family protein [Streptomyces sp. NPDC051555]|uniref:DciA family protein n=1 Tax=Streptomyces sp. NPDC051555 TaxID=3365657 RepID=UPI0037892ABE